MERRAATRDLSLRSELSARVDEAEARCRELQELLTKQKVAYDMLQVGGMSYDMLQVGGMSHDMLQVGGMSYDMLQVGGMSYVACGSNLMCSA